MRNEKLQKLIMICLICLVPVLAVAMQVYALVNQSIVRKYPLTIAADNVVFLYNERTYLDEIGSDFLDLYKGEPTDIVMSVRVLGSAKVVVEYGITFTLVSGAEGEAVSALTEAIEVYCFRNGKYEFLCMLNEIDALDENGKNKVVIDGLMVTNFRHEIPLRLVYSATASKHYDDIVNGSDPLDNGGFTLHAINTATIAMESAQYVFADEYEEFARLFEAASTAGKTILLTSDIVVSENLISAGKVGIDLNGHKLTLAPNTTLTVDCKDDAVAFSSDKRLGITNSNHAADPAEDGLATGAGAGVRVINTTQCYLVDRLITTGVTVQDDPVTGNIGDVFEDVVALVRERTAKLTDGRMYVNGDDVSFIFDNLGYYLTQYNLFIGDGSVITFDQTPPPYEGNYKIAIDNPLTDKYLFAFIFSYNGASQKGATVSGYVTVRGNSPKAIADALAAGLPGLVTGNTAAGLLNASQYLRGYDAATASYITWHIEDGLGGNLLDDGGRYKKNGLDALLTRLAPTHDFSDRMLDVYIKITKGAETGNIVTGDNWFLYQVKAEALSASERTALLFDNLPVTLSVDTFPNDNFNENEYDILGTHLNAAYKTLLAEFLGEQATYAGLTGITVTIDPDEQTYPGAAYLEIYAPEDENDADLVARYENYHSVRIKEDAQIPQNTLSRAKLTITFTYYGGTDAQKAYTVAKDILVSGELAEVTRYDMSYRLQSALLVNPYVNGEAWWFYGYGALMPRTNGTPVPVWVDYNIQGDAAEYISVTYEFVPVAVADLQEGIAYFTFDSISGRYVPAQKVNAEGEYDPNGAYDPLDDYYERKVNIEVLADRVTHTEPLTAYIEAELYTVDANGIPHMIDTNDDTVPDKKIYLDPVSGKIQELSYELTLAVDGVIRNHPDQIADTNLYYVLRQLFDEDKDGIITYTEAQGWDRLIERYNGINTTTADRDLVERYLGETAETSAPTYYINLAGQTISSLKGVEYFRQVTGYNFTNVGISGLSALSELHSLKYLDFTGNTVTDLSPLAYMNQLEYLDLTDNRVINLEPLRYLQRLKYLNLTRNNVVNFEPLTRLTTLTELTLTGIGNFTTDFKTMYDFALVSINNPGVQFTYDMPLSFSAEMQVAAMVMRDVEQINRLRHVLYLPGSYYYDDGTAVTEYKLYWSTDANNDLTITYDANGNVQYTVIQSVYDKPIMLYLQVFTGVGTNSYEIKREFRLTLEKQTNAGGLYIYNGATGAYENAYEAIPDEALRGLIFETFNYDASATNVAAVGAPEKNVISAADLAYYSDKRIEYNWSNRGIRYLTGIELIRYGSPTATSPIGSLNLTGNPLASLTPLVGLPSLATLTLGGQKYDFTELTGLSSLRVLNVYDCLNLDTEDSLASLYALWCSNGDLVIYVKNGVPWDPFAQLMPKKVQNFPTVAAFTFKNDTFDLYEGKGNFAVSLYNTLYYFTVTDTIVLSKHATLNTNQFFTITTGTTLAASGGLVTYGTTQMYSSSDSSYAVITITSVDVISAARATKIAYANYNFQMIVNDASERIYVHNVADNPANPALEDGEGDGRFSVMTLGQLVGSRDLRSVALSNLMAYVQAVGNAPRGVQYNPNLTPGVGYMDTIRGYLTPQAPLISQGVLNNTGTQNFYNGAVPPLTGGYLATGAYSTTAQSASTALVNVWGRRHFSYFYYDEATGCYHITTDLLRRTSTTANSSMNTVVGSLTSYTTLTMYGTYESGSNMLNGLRYFTAITTLTLARDANLGDGSELVNLISLTITYSEVDLSTITTPLKLTTLSINNFYTFNATAAAMRCMPNLATLTIITGTSSTTSSTTVRMSYLKDYSFLTGLIRQEELVAGSGVLEEVSNLITLSLYGTLYAPAAYTVPVSATDATYVKSVWEATRRRTPGLTMTYRIGSPRTTTDTGYFRLVNNQMWYCTANGDNITDPASLTWDTASVPELAVSDATNYANVTAAAAMRDMGLKINATAVNQNFWANTRATALPSADQHTNETLRGFRLLGTDNLTLPASTGENYYGLEFDGVTMTREYAITWRYWFVSPSGAETTPIGGTVIAAGDRLASSFGGANGYLVLIGTMANATGGAGYSCFYHFIVGTGDGFYSTVPDRALRSWLFAKEHAALAADRVTTNIVANGYGIYGNAECLRLMGYTKLPGENLATNYICDLTGIDNVVRQWEIRRGDPANSLRDAITAITLQYQYFTDISPLFAFGNVETLNLNGSAAYPSRASLAGIDGGGGKFPNLTALNVSYNYNITPTDVAALLSGTQRPLLESLNFYYTNAMYNRIVATELNGYMLRNGVASISLSLNDQNTDVTAQAAVAKFLADTDTSAPAHAYYKGTGISTSNFNMTSGSANMTVGGISYAYAMTPEVWTLLVTYNVSNAVPLKLQITTTDAGYRQFSGTYVDTVFKRSDITAPMLFGTGNLPLVNVAADGYTPLYHPDGTLSDADINFDTELIAYLFSINRLTQTAGSFRLNANQVIAANFGIASLKNAITLHTTYRATFSATPGINLALAYQEVTYAMTATSGATNATFAVPTQNLLYYGYLDDVVPRYYYTGNNQPVFTYQLPTHIWYLGTRYPVTWSIFNVTGDVSALGYGPTPQPATSILSPNAVSGTTFRLDATTVAIHAAEGTGTVVLRANVTTSPAPVSPAPTTPLANSNITITIRKYAEIVTPGYDFFVEADSAKFTDLGGGLCNAAFSTGTGADYSLTDVPFTTLYLSGGIYYTDSGIAGATPVKVVYARDIFRSGRLAQYIYACYYANSAANVILDGVGGIQAGYIMTQADIAAMTVFNLEYGAVNTNYNQWYSQYVTSLEGMQIFRNITSFIAKGGSFIDITPLAGFHLEDFEYCNSYTDTTIPTYGNSYIITDFTPLLQGSKNSLQHFRYDGGNVMLTDMNFLLAFPNLEDVFLGYAYIINTTYFPAGHALRYFMMPAGRYVLTELWKRDVYIYAYQPRAAYVGLTVDTTKTVNITNYTYSVGVAGYPVYALLPFTEELVASEILSNFRSDMPGVTYGDNYTLTVGAGGYAAATGVRNGVTVDLNATITFGGKLYLIDWRKAGANVTVNGYFLSAPLTVGGVTYTANTPLTAAEAQIITDSVAYFEAYKSGANKLTTRIVVDTGDISPANTGGVQTLSDIQGLRLVARIYYQDYAYERMFTVKF